MIDKKKAAELAGDLREVLGNLDAVRGTAFATGVAGYFESKQLLEIFAILIGYAPDEDAEAAEAVAEAGVALLSSLARKAMIDLSESERDEVIKIGDSLIARRERATNGG